MGMVVMKFSLPVILLDELLKWVARNCQKKSHHITNSASFTNCGRLLKKKKKKKNWKLKEKKVHNSFNFVFCPNHAINWRPLKRKEKFWLFSYLTVCQKALMLKGTKPKGTKLKGTNLKKRQSLKIENSCCLLQPNNKINKSLPTYLMIYLLLY